MAPLLGPLVREVDATVDLWKKGSVENFLQLAGAHLRFNKQPSHRVYLPRAQCTDLETSHTSHLSGCMTGLSLHVLKPLTAEFKFCQRLRPNDVPRIAWVAVLLEILAEAHRQGS